MDELPEQVRRHSNIERLETQLGKYFAGTLQSFDLPLDLRRTPFQRASWEALLAIPYGEARSYREQAEGIGKPTAVRAVGRANGDNRVAIIVPCHRVVGAEGKLTGYVWRKRFLLELERENRRIETSEPAFPPRPGAWKPRSLVHRNRRFLLDLERGNLGL